MGLSHDKKKESKKEKTWRKGMFSSQFLTISMYQNFSGNRKLLALMILMRNCMILIIKKFMIDDLLMNLMRLHEYFWVSELFG